ncbi:MAG: leucine-rich repeat domain-containing protein, partial [Oscillospiraceae bacterium]|nr:leucine-rich repeat domain-containing protein [Oscillospiraceae bacterium]
GSAFAYCEALTSVSIPNGVQQIGYTAFRDCAKLENITIPESVTYIDETCFAYCAALTRIDVSADNQNYTSIDGVLFNKNVTTLIWYSTGSKNASYSVPASVETISARAFSNSSNLESIILTNHIKAIEDWAFFAVDLKEVWYQGSEAEKEFIQIGSSNEPLLSANWNYNSCASAITMLNAAKADLQAAIDKKADIASLNTKVDELMIAIAAAEATAKLYTDEKAIELTNAIITAKTEAVAVAKDLVDTAKTDLQTVIDKKADTVTVNTAIKNLQNAITALENAKDNYIAADAALKTELEAAIAKAKQEALDAAKGYIPYIGTNGNWWIGDTDTGVDANGIKGETGDGIAKIEKTSTQGNVDTYTITLSNGKTFTFTVTNGINGADGKDGVDGKDGLTPFIGENDNWWIGDTDTGMKASTDASVPVGSGNITEAEGVNTVTVVAIGVASLALLSNIVLVAWLVLKNKKSLV